MRADDEGFVGNPKKIMRMIGSQEDDYKVLLAKRFIIPFDSGVCVIKHWLIHNTIRMDRFTETTYQDEKNLLNTKENKSYTLMETSRQPSGNHLATQVKLSKVNLSKDKIETPAQISRNFFKNPEIAKEWELYDKEEIDKFISYWTELNKSGTKERWELQQTFDVKRRLQTWLSRAFKFGGKDENVLRVGNMTFTNRIDIQQAVNDGKIKWDKQIKKYVPN